MKAGFNSDTYDHSAANKAHWDKLTPEDREARAQLSRESFKKATQRSIELGCNFSTWDPEKKRRVSSEGGKIAGKIPMWTNGVINKRSHESPGEDWFLGITKRKQGTDLIVVYRKKDDE